MSSQLFQRYHDTTINTTRAVPKKRCLKKGFKSYIHSATIVYLLLLCLPSTSFGWRIPFLGSIFSNQENSDAKLHGIKYDKQSSINPIINHDKADFHAALTVRQPSDKDVEVPTGNGSFLIIGTLILGALVITSVFLYALDIYATSRIDQYLYDYYGPELYDRYTSVYDPTDNFSPYNSNGYYSATTASQYYGVRRSVEGPTIAAAAKILSWVENTMEIFEVASEFLREEKCREHLICEAYQRDYMSGIWGLVHLSKFLEYFPLFSKAKMASSDSKSRSEGCNYHYTGCAAISRTFHGREPIYGTHQI